MTFLDAAAVARDPDFQARVLVASLKAATNVSAENFTPGGDYQAYLRRAALAADMFQRGELRTAAWAWAVASQPGITGLNATDGDIEFTVNALWDHMAGVVDPES